MTTASELRDRILARSEEDDDFRSRLMEDPKGTIGAELNVSIPESFNIVVHEDTASTTHLVLPPSPKLTEADLQMAAGGSWDDFLHADGWFDI